MAYPLLAGLLLARVGKLKYVKNAFPLAAGLLVALLSIPRLGGTEEFWINGLYESICILLLFPFIIWLGAGGKAEGKKATKLCKFLGDISYPVYMTHYPLAYIYMGWVVDKNLTLKESWPYGLLMVIAAISLAYACMKFFDLPVREWLRKRFL